jgi:hypothetical protein
MAVKIGAASGQDQQPRVFQGIADGIRNGGWRRNSTALAQFSPEPRIGRGVSMWMMRMSGSSVQPGIVIIGKCRA